MNNARKLLKVRQISVANMDTLQERNAKKMRMLNWKIAKCLITHGIVKKPKVSLRLINQKSVCTQIRRLVNHDVRKMIIEISCSANYISGESIEAYFGRSFMVKCYRTV